MSSRILSLFVILGFLCAVTASAVNSPCALPRLERGKAAQGCADDEENIGGTCCQLWSKAMRYCPGGPDFEIRKPADGKCPPGTIDFSNECATLDICCRLSTTDGPCPGGHRFESGKVGSRGECPPNADALNGFCCARYPNESVCHGGATYELGAAKNGTCPRGFNLVEGYCCDPPPICPAGRRPAGPPLQSCPPGQLINSMNNYCCHE